MIHSSEIYLSEESEVRSSLITFFCKLLNNCPQDTWWSICDGVGDSHLKDR